MSGNIASAANVVVRSPLSRKLDKQMIQDDLFGLLTAGIGTTATTLSWAVKYLAAHPDIQSTLRSTLVAAAESSGNKSASLVTNSSIPYLDAFIAEVLRVSSIAPAIVRTTVIDTKILGHVVPKGTNLYLLPDGPGVLRPAVSGHPGMARDASSSSQQFPSSKKWGDANIGEFQPERWLRSSDGATEVFDPQAGPTLAFGYGLRGCFGTSQSRCIEDWKRQLTAS